MGEPTPRSERRDDAITPRRAVRAFILNEQKEVLLLRIKGPSGEVFWVAPGGGIDPEESPEEALRRELREELGLLSCDIGPLLWQRQHTFNWSGRRLCQSENYYAVHVGHFHAHMLDEKEGIWVSGLRWWPIEDLSVATERLTPLSIASILVGYLSDGPPSVLPPVETLID